MLYYQGYTISFQEVPDETSMVILIADCPYRCPGCHSPNLQKPKGKDLEQDLMSLIEPYKKAITCVCFMGEGRDDAALHRCARMVHNMGLKTALYTGAEAVLFLDYEKDFDYLKTGPYIREVGGLDHPETNQRMFHFTRHRNGIVQYDDITYRFQQKKF